MHAGESRSCSAVPQTANESQGLRRQVLNAHRNLHPCSLVRSGIVMPPGYLSKTLVGASSACALGVQVVLPRGALTQLHGMAHGCDRGSLSSAQGVCALLRCVTCAGYVRRYVAATCRRVYHGHLAVSSSSGIVTPTPRSITVDQLHEMLNAGQRGTQESR